MTVYMFLRIRISRSIPVSIAFSPGFNAPSSCRSLFKSTADVDTRSHRLDAKSIG